MGQQSSSSSSNKSKKKKSLQQSARIQSLYQMYNESIRIGTLIRTQSGDDVNNISQSRADIKRKQKRQKKQLKQEQEFLQELLYPFVERSEFTWGEEIPLLFKKHFGVGFEAKWEESKELFYQLLLENVGVESDTIEKSHLGMKSHIGLRSHIGLKSHINDNLTPPLLTETSKLTKSKPQTPQSYEQHFLKMIKQKSEFQIRGSFFLNDEIDRKKEEEIAQVESQRMTLEEEINFINESIIDAEEGRAAQSESENRVDDTPIMGIENDDQYFLPLITKRRNHTSNKKLSQRISCQLQSSFNHPHIQMSHMPSQVKYSRLRLQSTSVILPSTIFYQRMNFSAKVQTDQSLKIYRQLSNTIQQTINSCNLISCPLKHFLLYFEYKTSRKNINQLEKGSSNVNSASQIQVKMMANDDDTISIKTLKTVESAQSHTKVNDMRIKKPHTHRSLTSHHHPQNNDLYNILTEMSQKSEIIRKKREFNTNYLLKEIQQFTESYTQFLFLYLNLNQIEQTDLSSFINIDTVYGIVLRNIWNIVTWIAERGYQWEEYTLRELCQKESPGFQTFTQEEILERPQVIIQKYARFCNKDVKKIKTLPQRLIKAFQSLLKLKHQVFPQKYLKKIIIFYRQATKCCQGADDLMSLYQFLVKNCILLGFTQQMHIFRMKNIIERLIPVESTVDGAGEIVYAWTTWNIILEMFLLRLNQYKGVVLKERERQGRRVDGGKIDSHNTEKKRHKQQKHSLTEVKRQVEKQPIIRSNIMSKDELRVKQNPERKAQRNLQFQLTSFLQTD